MNFEIDGTIIEIFDLVSVSERFKKQEFVIEHTENNSGAEYTDFIKFQLTQNRTELLSQFGVGDKVKVSFNIRGNKWVKDGKVSYFTNLDTWRIEKIKNQNEEVPPIQDYPEMEEVPPEQAIDDLPF